MENFFSTTEEERDALINMVRGGSLHKGMRVVYLHTDRSPPYDIEEYGFLDVFLLETEGGEMAGTVPVHRLIRTNKELAFRLFSMVEFRCLDDEGEWDEGEWDEEDYEPYEQLWADEDV
jgi:hypothetical protein